MIRLLLQLLARRAAADTAETWCRDPLSHPAIRRMTERERADLPFAPEQVCPE